MINGEGARADDLGDLGLVLHAIGGPAVTIQGPEPELLALASALPFAPCGLHELPDLVHYREVCRWRQQCPMNVKPPILINIDAEPVGERATFEHSL